VEEYGHIGHGAILHGCIIRKNVLVGMNSVILDEAEIGENTIIGANSTVKAKAKIPENSLALGSPAKVIRPLEAKEIAWKSQGTQEYIQLTQRCLSSMYEVEPLLEDSAERLTYQVFAAEYKIKQNS
jgi:phenylacetic acid degradation protein